MKSFTSPGRLQTSISFPSEERFHFVIIAKEKLNFKVNPEKKEGEGCYHYFFFRRISDIVRFIIMLAARQE